MSRSIQIWCCLILLVVLLSCVGGPRYSAQDGNLPAGDFTTHTYCAAALEEKIYIDSAYVFTLLNEQTDSVLFLLRTLDAFWRDKWAEDETEWSLTWYHVDFDSITGKELVLHFRAEIYLLDIIYTLTPVDQRYRILSPPRLGGEDAYNGDPPIIDVEAHRICAKERIWGICIGGCNWDVYAFRKSGFRRVLSFIGEHSHNSCGVQEPEEYWHVETRHQWLSPDTMLLYSHLEHSVYKHNAKTGKNTTLNRETINVTLYYVYAAARDSFLLYNSRGRLIESNPFWGEEFWNLQEKGEL